MVGYCLYGTLLLHLRSACPLQIRAHHHIDVYTYINQGECIFGNEKPKSFQGPKAGPGPWLIQAHFVCATLLHPVGKTSMKNFFPPPHDQNPRSASDIIHEG